ncbi:hypothetical protein KI688_003708 [Linnemannia hyalina]|uniref:Guanylate cyclase domain-containing protein n=1 Tax=Linnemannia hyalina TaxID=64524 RepID=A0A9P7XPY9_9FUNG|nr:hypothetical protein KI688_003708 [Linnemannia hyalina]
MSNGSSSPSINIAPYMFVRSLHDEEERNLEMPFHYTQFGAVLMVDIVGFSQMTSTASSKGDVGAEMLSSQIGTYFDLAIRIIEYHGGDVVKFLGDALLVVFQPDPVCDDHQTDDSNNLTPMDSPTTEEPAAASRRSKVTVRKAVECGLELLARLSNYRIYLSEKEFSRKFSGPNVDDGSGYGGNDDGSNCNLFPSNGNQSGNSNNQWNNTYTNATVISGNGSISASSFLSVPISRPNSNGNNNNSSNGNNGITTRRSSVPTNNNSSGMPNKFSSSNNLDIAGGHRKWDDSLMTPSRPGSTTSKSNRAASFFSNAKNLFTHSSSQSDRQNITPEDLLEDSFELQLHMAMSAGPISNIIIGDIGLENGLDNLLLQTTGRLEYAICGEQMSTIDDALGMARAGELTITAAAWSFVNPTAYPWYEERRQCFILKNIQSANDDPLLRRIRNDKLLNTSVESNPHYYKYINKSAIHRLILYPDNTFPAQFRTVTILFVSLGDVKPWTREGLDTCQKAIYQVHKITSEYEVDDKGATLLCAFGLPYPRSHEREAVFAAKSAWVIRRRLLAEGIHGFKISLATGVIFTSMIGNEFRRDPAIVGDTIVIAVRILKFDYATESVVCDDATKEACTSDHDGLCEFEDMGEEFVKGKMQRIRVWRLVHFGAKKQIRRPDDIMVDETIGYEPEREKVSQFIKTWEKEPDKNTILVAGPRGSGKSMFYQQICHIADRNNYNVCSAASAEVEKNTEYYLCKFLLLGLFDIMRKREIPYAGRTHLDLGMAIGQANYESQNWTPTTMASTIVSGGLDESVGGTPCSANSVYSPISSHFGPSVRSSMASSSPWDLSLGPAISQYSDPTATKRSSMYITKLQSLINVSLQKMGEGDEIMHMLHDIIAALSSDNSAPVMNDRDDKMLADFIVRMLNYASTFVKIIVMFEDVQWTDSKSLQIIQVIHERCPAVLVVIFSRPQRDYGSNPLHSLTGHAKHLEIVLEGLKRRDIELALLKTFEDKNVTRINPAVIELVQEKTKGNPKFVKNMTTMLKDFCFVNIVDGELLTTGKESIQTPSYKNMEEMLVKQDRKKMILMQYDRMTARFQDFLKIASCLGEQFSLAEVAAIRPLETMLGVPEPGRSFSTLISDLDTFRFLSLATEQLMNVQFSDNLSMNTLYMFSSESTAKDIYESIPYEERVGYHLTMGQFYEAFLEPAQFSDLLPLITRHYLKTDHTEKKIKYLKAISAFDLKSNMLPDATQSLTGLIQILDTVRGAANMVSQEDLAEIYGMKGEALSKRMRIEEAEPALLDSLARYGVHWPKNSQQWKMALFVEKTKFIFHYHGGTTPGLVLPGKSVKAKVDARTQITLQRIIRVLGCLQNIYFWKTEPNAAMLSTLYTLNYSRRLGLPSGEQTVSLGRYAILNYFKGNHHTCREYMQKARLANDAGEGTEGMLPSMQGYVAYCEGHRERAHAYLSEAINESKSFGVVSNLATYYRSVTLKCSYRMWEGSFNVHPEDSALLRAMSAVAIQNGDSEGETLFAIPTLANLLLQDRLRDAESWVVLVERFILPKARLMNMLVMHGMLSYYYAKMGQFNKTKIYATLLSERIADQGVAAHPFPLMSCAFVVMAIFVLLDSASPSLVNIPVDPLLASDTELILRPVIQCLSQDPFQTVSECFMTLADSIRCFILQGAFHQREGYQKLLRGWERSRSQTQGMQFVQAYYLSKLGQYADVVEEKDGFYSEAYVLFKKMSMDPTDWLTDPSPKWQPPFVAEVPLPEFSIPTPS